MTFEPVDSKPDFLQIENKWLKAWQKKGTIKKYLKKNDQSPNRFSFFDGPITANNPMGVHHAWGRTYKDLWQKFYNLLGYRQRFQNGFDCQGLWVEVEVEKNLQLKNKREIENLVPGNKKASIDKFVNLCKQRVNKFAAIQTDQSKRLGYFMDWENSYFTMSDQNNYMIWHFLKKCHQHGWIYKGRESVPWCPRCQTAISQHEMLTEDYKEVTHEAIYFELPLEGKNDEFLLVWTTTPWTIPANIAVAVDKKLDYSLVQGRDKNKFWLAKEAVDRIFGKERKIIKTVKGKSLVNLKYSAPFDHLPRVKEVKEKYPDKFHLVVATDPNILPINTKEGTGLVHTAVSAGSEDFKLGKKYGLPMIPIIDDQAVYFDGLGFLSGKNAKNNPRIILDYLIAEDKKAGVDWVFEIEKYRHRYPVCWRCKTELVWKVTDEWYIAMDKSSKIDKKNKLTFRQRMIKVAKKINWIPGFGRERELDWLKNMHDWLISKKNRYWGLSLPIYECLSCGHFEVIGSKDELKKRATAGWQNFSGHSPHKPWIDEVKISCSHCGKNIGRIDDVGNPWLDAGIIPFSTLVDPKTKKVSYLDDKKYWRQWFPADFITESFPGQFKNWFYVMIAMATGLENTNPYKTVLGFGTMVDENGRPFHKSTGNAIEFKEGADRFGADIIRWACLSANPSQNFGFGEGVARDVKRRFYLILWNSYRYLVNNLHQNKLRPTELTLDEKKITHVLDRWLLNKLATLAEEVKEDLKNYHSRPATEKIENFVNQLSTWYIRGTRKRSHPENDETDRQNYLTTLTFTLKSLMIIISPFLPFISEEIFTRLAPAGSSVHLQNWPSSIVPRLDKPLLDDMEVVKQIVETGHRVRKDKRVKLRQPLASVTLKTGREFQFKSSFKNQLISLIGNELNVKKVVLKKGRGKEIEAVYDLNLTPALKKEGERRDLIRKIQFMRKRLGLSLDEQINVFAPLEIHALIQEVGQEIKLKNLRLGEQLKIEKING